MSYFEDFYGELAFHPSRKYRYPFLRSKPFQYAVLSLLGVGIVLGIIGGVATRNDREEDGADDTAVRGGLPASDDNGDDTAWWNPGGQFDGLVGGVRQDGKPLDPQSAALYAAAYEKYEPQSFDRDSGWLGHTYKEAIEFCHISTLGKAVLCPYEAICPLGPGSVAAGGVRIDGLWTEGGVTHKEQWAPILSLTPDELDEKANTWVNIGSVGSCVRYEDSASGREEGPQWGLTGEGNHDITFNVICCANPTGEGEDEGQWSIEDSASVVGGGVSGGNQDANTIETALSNYKYQPKHYTRSTGWAGRTYTEAYQFCSSVTSDAGDAYTICPYDSICPLGKSGKPQWLLEGTGDYDGESWAPVSNKGNDWVRLDEEGETCVLYSASEGGMPDWGLSGEDNEEMTRHIFCCADIGGDGESDAPGNSDNLDQGDAIGRIYKPQWHGRSSDWNGSTYIDALQFCTSRGKNRMICPFAAICPFGELNSPYIGLPATLGSDGSELWAPVMDTLNDWVQIGNYKNVCALHSNVYPSPPTWGLTGSTAEEGDITPYVMCCELNEENESIGTTSTVVGESAVASSSPPPPPSPPEQQPKNDESVTNKFQPVSFSRATGWSGRTYNEATAFCASSHRDGAYSFSHFHVVVAYALLHPTLFSHTGSNLMVCPFEAIW